ncbi:MAG: COQ9 family protein [Pseudomonadota bacterium]
MNAMTEEPDDQSLDDTKRRVVEAALPDVAFDGWTDRTLADAVERAMVDPAMGRLAFPRGGVDLALAFHMQTDDDLAAALAAQDMEAMRYSEKVARAVETRLEMIAPHKEAVRRAAAMFALPVYAADGARAVWHTADAIWTALGDTSDDVNWYTKRAILSGVYSSAVLYWLGDQSEDMAKTRAFVARRIEDVMQFEKVKAAVRDNPIGKAVMAGPGRILDQIRKPQGGKPGFPGRWRD